MLAVAAADIALTVESLRALLAAIDSGELTAGPDQAAWLRGAVDALDAVAAGVDPAVSESWQ